jgi:2-haloalkanoic acid dehalogenase type II
MGYESRVSIARPKLFTFDLFGTLIDWRLGLKRAAAQYDRELTDQEFDRVIDLQGELESGQFRPYREIAAESFVRGIGMRDYAAKQIGETLGQWPLYPDVRDGLRALMEIAPCAATTNSDHAHRVQIEKELGFAMSGWICSEDVGAYKPSIEVWRFARQRLGLTFGPEWWHVSAYGDYDLETAHALHLTCVFVERPHARLGPADVHVRSLLDLARVVS